MKQIQFKSKQYNIPEGWNDVTLKQQMEVSTIANEQKYVKTLGIIGGYTSIPVEVLKSAKVHELERVMKHMSWISEPIPEEPIFEFIFNEHQYVVSNSMLDQEFQDYVAIQTAIAEYADNKWKVTPFILAVMCKRDGNESLDDYDINERAKEFEEISIVIANQVAAFFLSNSKVLNSITMFSSPQVQKDILQSKVAELNSSVKQLRKQRGGNLLIRLWVMITLKFTKSLSKRLEKYYSSQPLNNSKKKWKQTYKRLLSKMQKTKNQTK